MTCLCVFRFNWSRKMMESRPTGAWSTNKQSPEVNMSVTSLCLYYVISTIICHIAASYTACMHGCMPIAMLYSMKVLWLVNNHGFPMQIEFESIIL